MRTILMSMMEIETPADLRDGEVVQAIRLGGPRDGAKVGRFTVERGEEDEITLHPMVGADLAGVERVLDDERAA